MSSQEVQIVSSPIATTCTDKWTNHIAECAKRWQQSLDPDLDRSEWRDEEVCYKHWTTIMPCIDESIGSDPHCGDTTFGKALERHSARTLPRSVKELHQESVCSLLQLSSHYSDQDLATRSLCDDTRTKASLFPAVLAPPPNLAPHPLYRTTHQTATTIRTIQTCTAT